MRANIFRIKFGKISKNVHYFQVLTNFANIKYLPPYICGLDGIGIDYDSLFSLKAMRAVTYICVWISDGADLDEIMAVAQG